MRIALIGTHNVGKDTLSHHVFSKLKLTGKTVQYIPEMAEMGIMRGINLQTKIGQMWVLTSQIAAEMECISWNKREFVVCNRSAIDSIPYVWNMGDVEFSARIEEMVIEYLKAFPYDKVFWLRPLPTLHNDGVRMNNREEQLRIDESFQIVLNFLNIPHTEINARTKEERVVQLNEEIAKICQ